MSQGLLGAVLLSNLSTLAFELTLTRIFSVTLWYHLAFMVVTIAMFGLGAGGLVVYFLAGKIHEGRLRPWLADLEGIKALLTAFFIVVYLRIPFVPGQVIQPTVKALPVVSLIFLLAALPFLLAGMINGLAFCRMSGQIGRLYFADLTGAAAGVLFSIAGLYLVKAPSLVLSAAALSAGAAVLFLGRLKAPAAARVALALAVTLFLLVYNLATDAVSIRYVKNYVEKKVYYEKWSPIARITVIRFPLLTWGLGSRFSGWLPPEDYLIEQDGAAGTPVIPAGTGWDLSWLDWDVTSAPYWIMRPASAAIIGSGGGKDILSAWRAGVRRIVAVEINPDIVEVVQKKFAHLSGRPYDLPGVVKVIAEGRNYLTRTDERFGLIQLSMVDSWAATTAGAFMMSENHLYTLEAFDAYLARLEPQGALALSRYLLGFFPVETMRAFSLAAEALRRAGAADPGAHMLLLHSGDIGTLIVKKTPLGEAEEKRAIAEAETRGYKVVFSPSMRGEGTSPFGLLAAASAPIGFYKEFLVDVTPPTDDRPFFFFGLKPGMWLWQRWHGRFDPGIGLPQNMGAALLVRNIFVTATLFALLILIIPLLFRAGRRRASGVRAVWIVYFASIGAGFMFVEIPLIQKLILPLGHPVMATAVALCGLLLFSGLGSFFWGRARAGTEAGRIALVTGGAALVALLYYLLIGRAAALLLPLAAPVRVILALALIAPAGFLMGGAFPLAVRRAGESAPASIPWMWGVNGAFSVQSSVLAMMLSIGIGFRVCFLAAAAAYLLACVAGLRFNGRT